MDDRVKEFVDEWQTRYEITLRAAVEAKSLFDNPLFRMMCEAEIVDSRYDSLFRDIRRRIADSPDQLTIQWVKGFKDACELVLSQHKRSYDRVSALTDPLQDAAVALSALLERAIGAARVLSGRNSFRIACEDRIKDAAWSWMTATFTLEPLRFEIFPREEKAAVSPYQQQMHENLRAAYQQQIDSLEDAEVKNG